MDLLDRLLGHDAWATAFLIDRAQDLSDAQLDQPFDLGQGTLRRTFAHQVVAVAFWTGLMTGDPAPAQPEGLSLAELAERHARSHARFAALARQLRDEGRLDDTFVDHLGKRRTFGGAVAHTMLHNGEHRAEVRHLLNRLGVADVGDADLLDWEREAAG